jgi:hypothetical protein
LTKAGQILSMIDAGALGTGGFSPYHKALTRLQAEARLRCVAACYEYAEIEYAALPVKPAKPEYSLLRCTPTDLDASNLR